MLNCFVVTINMIMYFASCYTCKYVSGCFKVKYIVIVIDSHFQTCTLNLIYINQITTINDDFDFVIITVPHLSSNILTSPAYGIYISQLILY